MAEFYGDLDFTIAPANEDDGDCGTSDRETGTGISIQSLTEFDFLVPARGGYSYEKVRISLDCEKFLSISCELSFFKTVDLSLGSV